MFLIYDLNATIFCYVQFNPPPKKIESVSWIQNMWKLETLYSVVTDIVRWV